MQITRIEDYEIHIPGFMPLKSNDNLRSLGYSILQAISPTLTLDEITNVRLLNNTDCQNKDTEGSLGISGFPSFIIRLSSSIRVKQIIITKKNINYFNTRDINRSLLDSELASRLPCTKIFINESLSSSENKSFKSLKSIAKSIGFRFVWHRGGKFLVRWNLGMPEHYISNPSDLHVIKTIYAGESQLPAHIAPTAYRDNTQNQILNK